MDVNASHMGSVIGSYALSAIMLLGLVIYVFARDRSLRAQVQRLEQGRRKEQP